MSTNKDHNDFMEIKKACYQTMVSDFLLRCQMAQAAVGIYSAMGTAIVAAMIVILSTIIKESQEQAQVQAYILANVFLGVFGIAITGICSIYLHYQKKWLETYREKINKYWTPDFEEKSLITNAIEDLNNLMPRTMLVASFVLFLVLYIVMSISSIINFWV